MNTPTGMFPVVFGSHLGQLTLAKNSGKTAEIPGETAEMCDYHGE